MITSVYSKITAPAAEMRQLREPDTRLQETLDYDMITIIAIVESMSRNNTAGCDSIGDLITNVDHTCRCRPQQLTPRRLGFRENKYHRLI